MDWKTLESKELLQLGLFRLRQDRCQMPDGRVMPRYYVMEFSDWVNIVPVTHDNKIIMVEQYRHGSGRVHLELPGGATEPGATEPSQTEPRLKEDPKRGALRELIEETGYVPDDIRLVGKHYPNPSLQNNAMWTYIGFGCRKQAAPTPDPYENIKVVELTVSEVYQKVQSGEIDHSLVVASLHYAMAFLGIR